MSKQATRKYDDDFALAQDLTDASPDDFTLNASDAEKSDAVEKHDDKMEAVFSAPKPSEADASLQINDSLGPFLAQTRKARGLSINDVAENLHLEQRVIQAIENDDKAALPPTIFVQGYLRNYAKLLNLPVEQVLAHYRAQPDTQPAPLLYSEVIRQPQVGSGRGWFKLMSLIIAIGLPVLSGLWYYNTHIQPETPKALDEMPAISETVQPLPPIADKVIDDMSGAASGANTPSSYTPPSEAASKEEENENGVTATADSTEVPRTTPTEPGGETTDNANSSIAQALQEGTSETDSAATAEEPPAVTNHRLTLKMRGNSWLEIQESGGKKLFAGILGKGKDLNLEGKAPYKVVIGRPHEVESISYAGEAVDLSGYHTGVARFSLGE